MERATKSGWLHNSVKLGPGYLDDAIVPSGRVALTALTDWSVFVSSLARGHIIACRMGAAVVFAPWPASYLLKSRSAWREAASQTVSWLGAQGPLAAVTPPTA